MNNLSKCSNCKAMFEDMDGLKNHIKISPSCLNSLKKSVTNQRDMISRQSSIQYNSPNSARGRADSRERSYSRGRSDSRGHSYSRSHSRSHSRGRSYSRQRSRERSDSRSRTNTRRRADSRERANSRGRTDTEDLSKIMCRFEFSANGCDKKGCQYMHPYKNMRSNQNNKMQPYESRTQTRQMQPYESQTQTRQMQPYESRTQTRQMQVVNNQQRGTIGKTDMMNSIFCNISGTSTGNYMAREVITIERVHSSQESSKTPRQVYERISGFRESGYQQKEQEQKPYESRQIQQSKMIGDGRNDAVLAYISEDEELCKEYMENGISKMLIENANYKNNKKTQSAIQSIIRSQNVSLCFLVDSTGSMSPYIDGIKKQIKDIIKKIENSNCRIFGFAFVGYRDWDHKENQYSILDFTTDINKFNNFLSGVRTIGGTDLPEDVIGGLNKAINNISWPEESSSRIIFHIGDYPPHGKHYHTHEMRDNYPTGHPDDKPLPLLFSELRSKNIIYYFGQVTEYCTKMIEIFTKHYGSEIKSYDTKNPSNITLSVIDSVSKSVSISNQKIMTSMKNSGGKDRTYTIDRNEPDFNELPVYDGMMIVYELPNEVNEIVSFSKFKENSKKCRLQIANNPFDKGGVRLAYHGRAIYYDKSNGTKTKDEIVLKEFIRKPLSSSLEKNRYASELEVQTVASKLALMFNTELDKVMNSMYKLKFLMIKICQIKYPNGNSRFMFLEKKFQFNGSEMMKYTNNVNYIVDESTLDDDGKYRLKLLLAFSHFTYDITNGYLLVNDLQGITTEKNKKRILLLTDPAISCKDLRFGVTNLGEDSINAFFDRHRCNDFCRALKLTQYKSSSKSLTNQLSSSRRTSSQIQPSLSSQIESSFTEMD
jgi:hypothetical protein